MLLNKNFDIIWNNGCGAGIVQNVITAASLHRAWAEESKPVRGGRLLLNPLHYWTFAIERFNYGRRRFSKVIAISHLIKQYLIKYYNLPSENIEVIHHGVNLSEFRPFIDAKLRNSKRESLGVTDEHTLLLFVGKEFKRKGLQYVLEVMKSLKDEKLVLLVIGGGEINHFIAVAEGMGLSRKVIFLGHLSDVADYFAVADIFVFPSTFDAFGMVVLEAMASGLPVITSLSVGASELIEHMKDGIVLKDYSDITEIRGAIKLLAIRDVRQQFALNALKKAGACSWDNVAEKTMSVFKEIKLQKRK